MKAGCDDFLSKPIKDTLLFDQIARYLPVTYIYDEGSTLEIDALPDSQNFEIEDLSFMSPQWLEKVEQAVSQLDENLLRRLIDEIPHEHHLVKEALINKAANFDFDVILKIVS